MTPDQYREMRLAIGMTQADLAGRLGLPREAIVRREAGTQRITTEAEIALRALAKLPADMRKRIELLTAERDGARKERNYYQAELRKLGR